MRKPFTIAVPRYYIYGINKEFLDIFNKRENAITKAIEFASDFPGATFLVVKKVFYKEETIFTIKLDINVDFADTQTFYQGMLKAYEKKMHKIKYWRKFDGNS